MTTIRPLTEDDREANHALRQQAFTARPDPFDPDRPRGDPERDIELGAFDGGRLIATATAFRAVQWFGGAEVPLGGVAGVATAPHARGGGAGRRLMLELLGEMRERRFAISTLYPATTSFYRALGWEVGGTWLRTTTPSRSLAALPSPTDDIAMRPASLDDGDDLTSLRSCYRDVAEGRAGWLDRSDTYWARRRWDAGREDGPQRHLYIAERDGDVVGYLAYRHVEDDPLFYGIQIDDLIGRDLAAMQTMLRLTGSNRTVTDRVAWRGADLDTLVLVLLEQDVEVDDLWHWMTRLVDVEAAVSARRYLASVRTEVPLEIVDEHAPWNAGPRWFVVRDGEGRLESGGPGRVRLDVGALAALYTGWASPRDLVRVGRLHGAEQDDLDGLAAAFAGPRPWLPDFF